MAITYKSTLRDNHPSSLSVEHETERAEFCLNVSGAFSQSSLDSLSLWKWVDVGVSHTGVRGGALVLGVKRPQGRRRGSDRGGGRLQVARSPPEALQGALEHRNVFAQPFKSLLLHTSYFAPW